MFCNSYFPFYKHSIKKIKKKCVLATCCKLLNSLLFLKWLLVYLNYIVGISEMVITISGMVFGFPEIVKESFT